jgi:hypothetical protein
LDQIGRIFRNPLAEGTFKIPIVTSNQLYKSLIGFGELVEVSEDSKALGEDLEIFL